MPTPLYRFTFIILSLTLMGQQCIRFGGGGAQGGSAGGVFKSVDQGQEWQHKVAVPTPAGIRNFGGANVVTLAIDPQDHLAIYAGTRENGMFYSYDGGELWHQPKDIASGFVAAIAVSPENKCTIYVATGNRILRSTDCSRTFEAIYNAPAPDAFISAIAINPFNPAIIYAGAVKGTLLKSADRGNSWANKGNLKGRIVDVVPDPRNSSVLYVAVAGRGVWRSDNGGETFIDTSEAMKTIKDAKDVRRLVADSATASALVLASRNKLLRTTDGGASWTALPIISPETVELSTLAVNPRNSKEIYYGTATTFYRSLDGGQQWSTEKLPTGRTATALLVDFQEPKTIYLGVTEIKK